MKKLALALLLAACSGEEYAPPTPEQEQMAAEVVWVQQYGMPREAMPKTAYREQDCTTSYGAAGITIPEWPGYCDDGYYLTGSQVINVLWYRHYWYSAYAHELMHVKLYYTTGDPDKDHTRPEWSIDVPAANQALRAAGL